MLRKSSLFAQLFTWQTSQRSSRWLSTVLFRYSLLVLLHCLSINLTGCLQRRLCLKWRQNITRKLHRVYFEKQNFYRLQSETKEHVITDADLRICRDVHEMAHATSEVAVSLIEALVKTLILTGSTVLQKRWLGGFFPPAVFLLFGFDFQQCCLIFYYSSNSNLAIRCFNGFSLSLLLPRLAVKIVLGTHPADGKNVQASLAHFEGRLKQHFIRLQSRSDTWFCFR